MLSFDEYLERKLKDPEFKRLWEETAEEREQEKQRIRAEIEREKMQADEVTTKIAS